MTFARPYTRNSKTTVRIQILYISCTDCSTVGNIYFLYRVECEVRLVSYGSKHSKQFFPLSHLWVVTCITWQYECSAYRITALLSDTLLAWFRVARYIQLENYGPRNTSVVLWYKLVRWATTHDNWNSHTLWLHITHQMMALLPRIHRFTTTMLASYNTLFSVFSVNRVH